MALDEIKIGGLGASRRRVEDNRFIRGKGNYVDDIVLPGMLHMEILRSPVAHARIKSIDVSKAYEIPGVRLVLTGEMMAARNLAWMPTLSYDTQAVLATDKVRFQGQEVAAVIADDPYIAKDACEAIVVEYEQLPAIVNPMQAMAADSVVIRDDKENQPGNKVFDWEIGDKAATDKAFAEADVISKMELHYPRSHPSPMETCGSIADFDRATGKLTVYMTSQDRKSTRLNSSHHTISYAVFCHAAVRAGNAGNSQALRCSFGFDLVAHNADVFGLRPDKPDPMALQDFGEAGIFRQKSITGMNRISAGDFACR